MNVTTDSSDHDEEKRQEQDPQTYSLPAGTRFYTVIGKRGFNLLRSPSDIPVSNDFVQRQQAVEDVAKANPDNIQEVAASQLSIINSYYQSGLQQSQQSFRWSLIWGGVGLIFLITTIGFLLIRLPAEAAVASGAIGTAVGVYASRYQNLYKHASDQLAEFRTSLESTQRLLLANTMCEKLEGELEQKTRSELICLMVQSATNLTPKER